MTVVELTAALSKTLPECSVHRTQRMLRELWRTPQQVWTPHPQYWDSVKGNPVERYLAWIEVYADAYSENTAQEPVVAARILCRFVRYWRHGHRIPARDRVPQAQWGPVWKRAVACLLSSSTSKTPPCANLVSSTLAFVLQEKRIPLTMGERQELVPAVLSYARGLEGRAARNLNLHRLATICDLAGGEIAIVLEPQES